MDTANFYLLCLLLGSLAFTLLWRRQKKQKVTRKHWVRPWIRRRQDPNQLTMIDLHKELLIDGDVEEFRSTLRMEPTVYNQLLSLLIPHLSKKHTNCRQPISPERRLAVTMRFLALGEGFRTLSQQFRIGLSTCRLIVRETCQIVFNVMKDRYLRTPNTEQQWKDIADEFLQKWDFPHCLGAIDGKHIRIMAPRNSGTFFFNYKDYFSIILLAIVNGNYEFIYVDAGAEGKASDGGIWNQCSFFQHMHHPDNPLHLPESENIEGIPNRLPYFLVSDDAFALSPNVMKPYGGLALSMKKQIFNYRLSRARRIVENVFGILTCRFKVFRRTLEVAPEFVEDIILATCTLHNYLRRHAGNSYLPSIAVDQELNDGNMLPGAWRQEVMLEGLQKTSQRNASQQAKAIRNDIADYFLTAPGEVPWQYREALM